MLRPEYAVIKKCGHAEGRAKRGVTAKWSFPGQAWIRDGESGGPNPLNSLGIFFFSVDRVGGFDIIPSILALRPQGAGKGRLRSRKSQNSGAIFGKKIVP
jgi:hypothetical protein